MDGPTGDFVLTYDIIFSENLLVTVFWAKNFISGNHFAIKCTPDGVPVQKTLKYDSFLS